MVYNERPMSPSVRLRNCLAIAAALLGFSVLMFTSAFFAGAAYAEDIDTNPVPDALQQQIEQTAIDYNDASVRVEEAQRAVEENQAQIKTLESELAVQQERGKKAVHDLYMLQQQTPSVVDLFLGSASLDEFLQYYEYITHASDANMSEIQKMRALKSDLEESQQELAQARDEADAQMVAAANALSAAQEARMEAQRLAMEKQRTVPDPEADGEGAAEQNANGGAGASSEEAGSPSEAEGEKASEETASEEDSSDDAASEKPVEEGESGEDEDKPSEDEEPAADEAADSEEEDSDEEDSDEEEFPLSEVNWDVDEESFVSEWADRINAYLSGTELDGYGKEFAQAAWDYGVDPRWSPAISYTESSCGASCFASHNAWGWGSEEWDSWEEAISDHVAGLARGYGYTISKEAAAKYCPPNADFWYDTTLTQMTYI